MSERPTPETDARTYVTSNSSWTRLTIWRIAENIKAHCQEKERERDEARAVAYDLATIASHCLGWHDHETGEAAERIATALKRWKSAEKFGKPYQLTEPSQLVQRT